MAGRIGQHALLLAAFSAGNVALAQSSTWIGPDGGNWMTAGNWSPAGIPNGGDVTFAPADNSVYSFDGGGSPSISINSLQFGTPGGGAPTLVQAGGTLSSGTENYDSGTYIQDG